MKFRMNMFLDTRSKNFKVIGQGHSTGFSDFSPLRDRAKIVCGHDNSWNAALSLMILRVKMYLHNL